MTERPSGASAERWKGSGQREAVPRPWWPTQRCRRRTRRSLLCQGQAVPGPTRPACRPGGGPGWPGGPSWPTSLAAPCWAAPA